jgi:hypothetical protein
MKEKGRHQMMGKRYQMLMALFMAAGLLVPAHALTVSGGSIFTTDLEEIIVSFQGSEAAYTNLLFEDAPNDVFIFNAKTATSGQTVNLGCFAGGTELLFRLDSYSTQGDFINSWFTGPASRNSDGTVHAITSFLGNNTWSVSWEDLDFNSPGYDGDFNDLIMTVQGTVIPEPGTLALVGIGLASFTGLIRRRRNRR